MKITMPYGDAWQTASFPWGRHLDTVESATVPALPDLAQTVHAAFDAPIGLEKSLGELVQPNDKTVIVVSDQHRRTGIEQVLPLLFERLNQAGVPDESIQFLVATGAHRSPTLREQAGILGEALFDRFEERIYVHDAHDEGQLIYLGETSRGTPVRVNRIACEADRLIVTGTVVLHYFGGFGGGRKAIVPGLAGFDTIAHNHALNLDPSEDRLNPAVRIGTMAGNPVAEDMLEAARMVSCDFLINTVLNGDSKIAGVFCGGLVAAHEAAAQFAGQVHRVPIVEKADLVVASSPHTRDFVQTHKALYNAFQALKPHGRLVLLAPCPEGLGGEQFIKWLRRRTSRRIIPELRQHAEINGQTALSALQKAPFTLLVTDMTDGDVVILGAQKSPSLAAGLLTARAQLRAAGVEDPTYILMPNAAYTVPLLHEDPVVYSADT